MCSEVYLLLFEPCPSARPTPTLPATSIYYFLFSELLETLLALASLLSLLASASLLSNAFTFVRDPIILPPLSRTQRAMVPAEILVKDATKASPARILRAAVK